ncbi:MAG TPA: hypothetical protein VG758_27015 [Hyphomicrobiaceae bacterium]|jgi:hypothetical protein|nr:hypothetical protein [Hyphomicrobiaceae bacterium]
MALTGRFNFRRTWFGGLALDVEEDVRPLFARGAKLKRRWRRATLMDLAQPEMRPLIDLRLQPVFMTRAARRWTNATEGVSAPAASSDENSRPISEAPVRPSGAHIPEA